MNSGLSGEGIIRQSGLHGWLAGLPADSIDRLRSINLSTGSAKHVILALTFGLYDRNICRLNKMITGMLIARLRAERAGKVKLVARINCFMEEMHESIDRATGVGASARRSGNPCNRPGRTANFARS
jgi:hypothetical protein